MAPALRDPGPIEFEAVLERSDDSGAACFVAFPFDLKTTYGKGDLVPVQVVYDGHAHYQGSLAYMGGVHALLLVRKDVLAQLGKDAGERIHVRVTLDSVIREITLPDDAQAAIDGSEPASASRNPQLFEAARVPALMRAPNARKPDTHASRRVSNCWLKASD